MRANEKPMSTIPEVILVSLTRPDIVLVEGEVALIELTIPHNSLESLSNARDRKLQNEIYLQALSDLEANGYASHTSERLDHFVTGFRLLSVPCSKQFNH